MPSKEQKRKLKRRLRHQKKLQLEALSKAAKKQQQIYKQTTKSIQEKEVSSAPSGFPLPNSKNAFKVEQEFIIKDEGGETYATPSSGFLATTPVVADSIKEEEEITPVCGKEGEITTVCVKEEGDITTVCVKEEGDITTVCVKEEGDITPVCVIEAAEITPVCVKEEGETYPVFFEEAVQTCIMDSQDSESRKRTIGAKAIINEDEVNSSIGHKCSARRKTTASSTEFLHSIERAVVRKRWSKKMAVFRKRWSKEETTIALRMIEKDCDGLILFSSLKVPNSAIYERVVSRLQRFGYNRTVMQVRSRIKQIRRVFHQEWERKMEHGEEPASPPWLALVHKLWVKAGKPIFGDSIMTGARRVNKMKPKINERECTESAHEQNNYGKELDLSRRMLSTVMLRGDVEESRRTTEDILPSHVNAPNNNLDTRNDSISTLLSITTRLESCIDRMEAVLQEAKNLLTQNKRKRSMCSHCIVNGNKESSQMND